MPQIDFAFGFKTFCVLTDGRKVGGEPNLGDWVKFEAEYPGISMTDMLDEDNVRVGPMAFLAWSVGSRTKQYAFGYHKLLEELVGIDLVFDESGLDPMPAPPPPS